MLFLQKIHYQEDKEDQDQITRDFTRRLHGRMYICDVRSSLESLVSSRGVQT